MACEKIAQPTQKQPIETKDFAHPYGFEVSRPVLPPRPRKTVLPVCMETKVPKAL